MKKKALITGTTGLGRSSSCQNLLLEKIIKFMELLEEVHLKKFNKLKSLNIHKDIVFCDFDLLELSNIQEVIKNQTK